jgi:purine-binding chemotaxis protein CheW
MPQENQLVIFKLGQEEYGVDIFQVREIRAVEAITRVPRSPEFIEGITNLRGKVIPIMDLGKRFELETKQRDKNTRIMVTELEGNTIGMLVDSVSEVLRLSPEDIEPPPTIATTVASEYIKGIGKKENRLIILLDLAKVLTEEEKSLVKEGKNNRMKSFTL